MEIVPGVHMVTGVRWARVYLIEDESLGLIDSGLPFSAGAIIKYIRSIGREPEELKLILVTHSHPDHSSGALAIRKRTGAEILAHPHDTKTHSNNVRSLRYRGLFGSLGVPLPLIRRTVIDKSVADGDEIPMFGGVEVIHTPGHTAGSVCYFLKSKGVLFSGDTIFSDGQRVSRSVPFPGYDAENYRQSLYRLAAMQFETLCGGHGDPLVQGASDRLRELLALRPELPTWGAFVKSIPRRLMRDKSLSGEEYS